MIEAVHQSMLNMWLRCGIQFERRYINGEIIPPAATARRGSASHRAADINARHMIEHEGTILPLDTLQDATRDEYIRLVKDEGVFIAPDKLSEKNAILNDNLNLAISAISKYHSDVAPIIKPIESEIKITADIGLSLPISGIIDLVEPHRPRDLKIRGMAKNQKSADAELQPSFYWELYKAHFGEYPEEFVFDEIIPLKTKTNYNPITTIRDAAAINRMKLYINAFLRDLQSGVFRPGDPMGWQCSENYCGYYPSCPYSVRKIAA